MSIGKENSRALDVWDVGAKQPFQLTVIRQVWNCGTLSVSRRDATCGEAFCIAALARSTSLIAARPHCYIETSGEKVHSRRAIRV